MTLKHFSSYLLIAMESASHPLLKFDVKNDAFDFLNANANPFLHKFKAFLAGLSTKILGQIVVDFMSSSP